MSSRSGEAGCKLLYFLPLRLMIAAARIVYSPDGAYTLCNSWLLGPTRVCPQRRHLDRFSHFAPTDKQTLKPIDISSNSSSHLPLLLAMLVMRAKKIFKSSSKCLRDKTDFFYRPMHISQRFYVFYSHFFTF